MEFLIKPTSTKKQQHHFVEELISKEQIRSIIGRDFNKSVANILGLVSLLEEGFTTGRDLDDIRRYLSTEANNLDVMVKNICK